jgi:hypothetical protein
MVEEGTKKAKILRQVQALLAQADGTPFTAEADTFRQKADELMTIYAIEEWQLQESGGVKVERVEKRVVNISTDGSIVQQEMNDLASAIAYHCRVRLVYVGRGGGRLPTQGHFIGYPSDLDFCELLHTSLHLKMATDLEPKYDHSQTKGQNVKKMKEAGMKWERIAQLCDIPFPGPQCITIYKRQCKEDGTQPMKTMPSVYVRNFAAGFVTEIQGRLLRMRQETEKNIQSTGQSLVLFDTRKKDIDSFVSAAFSSLSKAPVKASGKFDGNARSAGAKSGANADLSGGRRGAGTGVRGEIG